VAQWTFKNIGNDIGLANILNANGKERMTAQIAARLFDQHPVK